MTNDDIIPFNIEGVISIPEIKFSCTVLPYKEYPNKIRFYCSLSEYFIGAETFTGHLMYQHKFRNVKIAREELYAEVDEGENFEEVEEGVHLVSIEVFDGLDFNAHQKLNDLMEKNKIRREDVISDFKETIMSMFKIPTFYDKKKLRDLKAYSPEIFKDLKISEYVSENNSMINRIGIIPFVFRGTIIIPKIKFSCTVKPSKKDSNKIRFYCWLPEYFFKVEPFIDHIMYQYRLWDAEIVQEESYVEVEEGKYFDLTGDFGEPLIIIPTSNSFNFNSHLKLKDPMRRKKIRREELVYDFKLMIRDMFSIPIFFKRKELIDRQEAVSPEVFKDFEISELKE